MMRLSVQLEWFHPAISMGNHTSKRKPHTQHARTHTHTHRHTSIHTRTHTHKALSLSEILLHASQSALCVFVFDAINGGNRNDGNTTQAQRHPTRRPNKTGNTTKYKFWNPTKNEENTSGNRIREKNAGGSQEKSAESSVLPRTDPNIASLRNPPPIR